MDDRNPLSLLKSVREEIETIQRQVDYLIAVLDSEVKDDLSGIIRPGELERPVDLSLVNHVLEQMSSKDSQEGILDVLLARAGECADRVILFEVENGNLNAWKGLGVASDLLSNIMIREVNSPLFAAAQTGKVVFDEKPAEGVFSWLKVLGSLPETCLCVPLAFGSYVPLVLYADSSARLDVGSLELLGRLAVMHLQNHYLAYLLRENRGKEIVAQFETGAAPSKEERQEEADREEEVENWKEAELLEHEEDAFDTATLTEEEEEAAHEEARRLARLLVAEIKLYNEEEVENGRQNADLYRRLKTDIDRSRKMYEKRVHPLIKSKADYFSAEVIRVLAQDDPDLMGSDYERSEVSSPVDHSQE